jgi:hypothetical protein
VELSLNVPVAVKRCFWPTEIEEAVGVTAILSNVGAAITASVTSAVQNTQAALTLRVNVVRLK